MKQTTSFWERLKICYKVLTLDYYVYFGFNEDAILWKEDGKYKGLNEKGFAAFEYVSDKVKMYSHDKLTNLHDFFWHFIEKYARIQQETQK